MRDTYTPDQSIDLSLEEETAPALESGMLAESPSDMPTSRQQRVDLYVRQWLDEVYQRPEGKNSSDVFEAFDAFENGLERVEGSAPDAESTDAIRTFFRELSLFVRQRSRQPEERVRLAQFIEQVHERLFSQSPNLINRLPLPDQLLVTAEFSRQPETQGWIGANLIGEQTYGLSYCGPDTVREIVEQLERAPLPTLLDAIHQFPAIAANASANGKWADPALMRCRTILEQLKKSSPLPIVGFAVDAALARVIHEEQDPSVGFVKRYGDVGEGRLQDSTGERDREEHRRLSRTVIPDVPLTPGSQLRIIAPDAVGVFDHSGLPRGLVSLDVASLPPPESVAPNDTKELIDALSHPRGAEPRTLLRIVEALLNRVVLPQRSGRANVPVTVLAEELHGIAPQLSSESWNHLLSATNIQQDPEARQALALLQQQYAEFADAVQGYLAPIDAHLRQRLPTVSVQRYEDLPADERINPFSQDEGADLALLLQHLHRPAVREQIERATGIALRDLPLRSQVHFLRFVAGQDAEQFDRLRSTLLGNRESAPTIAEAFFAAAEDPAIGHDILAVAETLRLHPVVGRELFSAYRQYADSAEKHSREILESAERAHIASGLQTIDVVRHLLRRVNRLFPDLRVALEQDPAPVESVAHAIEGFQEEMEILDQLTREFTAVALATKNASGPRAVVHAARVEQSFRHLVLGEQEYRLPESTFADLGSETRELTFEQLPAREPLYFPVGISKDLPGWERVWEGKAKAAKPIDLYSYLFWLQNQGRKSEVVVCDTIQSSNYLNLYPERLGPQPEKGAKDRARKIGAAEQEYYRAICETFGLTNVAIKEYEPYLEQRRTRVEHYRSWCERLSEDPDWAYAFDEMVQESVGRPLTLEEKRRYLPYAIEELSWILAVDGTKVSHPNEARYDAIAAVLKNCESHAAAQQLDLADPNNRAAFQSLARGVLEGLADRINQLKAGADKGSDMAQYCDKFRRQLGLIRIPAGMKPPAGFSRKHVSLNVAVPATGAQSFGWRSAGEHGEQGVLKFKEPYSTYFYQDDAELFLDSDQVVAVPEGEISGKILALPAEQQAKYTERVIKPMLVQFFKVLEAAPAEYFASVGKDRDALLAECRQSHTLLDALKFIQRYIVAPVEARRAAPPEGVAPRVG